MDPRQTARTMMFKWNFSHTKIADEIEQAIRDAENAAIERSAQVAEGGSFVHENAPDALWGKACATAIRKLKTNPPK